MNTKAMESAENADKPSTGERKPRPARGGSLRSEGQRLLRDCGLSLAVVAARVGASSAAVSRWRSGLLVPADEFRAALESAGIAPTESWALPADGQGAGKPPASAQLAGASATCNPSTVEEAIELFRKLRLRESEPLTATERIQLAVVQASVLALRSKIEAQDEMASPAVLLGLPGWLAFKRTVMCDRLVRA